MRERHIERSARLTNCCQNVTYTKTGHYVQTVIPIFIESRTIERLWSLECALHVLLKRDVMAQVLLKISVVAICDLGFA